MIYFETHIGAVAVPEAHVQALAETETGFSVFGSDGKIWETKSEPTREVVTRIEGAEVWMAHRNPNTGRMAWTRAPLTHMTQRVGAHTGVPAVGPQVFAPMVWSDQQHNAYALVDNVRGSWARVEYITGLAPFQCGEWQSDLRDMVIDMTGDVLTRSAGHDTQTVWPDFLER